MKIRAHLLPSLSFFLFFVPACGGKILKISPDGGDPGVIGEPTVPPEEVAPPATSVAPAPSVSSSASATSATRPVRDDREACEIICDRNVRCLGVYPDCVEVCRQDGLDAQCGDLARKWNRCFAENVAQATCTYGPPACRESYCAYLACRAPERVADYCK